MPTYARLDDDGNVLEAITPEPGSLEDSRLQTAAADDDSPWSVHQPTDDGASADETDTAGADADQATDAPAPQGRSPRGPRARARSGATDDTAADSGNGEG